MAPSGKSTVRKEDIILPPRTNEAVIIGQKNISDHHFFVPLDLDVGMAAQYRAQTLMLSVSGYALFKPVIGEEEKQGFGWIVACGPENVRILPMASELEKGKET
jgi:hypothetical protein